MKNNTVSPVKTAENTAAVVTTKRTEDPQLNKVQQKIFSNTDLPKSEKFRRLYKNGLSKSHIARLFGSPYSFVRAAIDRQEGLVQEVQDKIAAKDAKKAGKPDPKVATIEQNLAEAEQEMMAEEEILAFSQTTE